MSYSNNRNKLLHQGLKPHCIHSLEFNQSVYRKKELFKRASSLLPAKTISAALCYHMLYEWLHNEHPDIENLQSLRNKKLTIKAIAHIFHNSNGDILALFQELMRDEGFYSSSFYLENSPRNLIDNIHIDKRPFLLASHSSTGKTLLQLCHRPGGVIFDSHFGYFKTHNCPANFSFVHQALMANYFPPQEQKIFKILSF